jgi:hypothetical protein
MTATRLASGARGLIGSAHCSTLSNVVRVSVSELDDGEHLPLGPAGARVAYDSMCSMLDFADQGRKNLDFPVQRRSSEQSGLPR